MPQRSPTEDIDALRAHGFTDAEIFDLAATAAPAAFFSKLLDALGPNRTRLSRARGRSAPLPDGGTARSASQAVEQMPVTFGDAPVGIALKIPLDTQDFQGIIDP